MRHVIDVVEAHAYQIRDYTLAGTLTTAPVWVQWITDVGTPTLAFICVLTGAFVGVRRAWRDIKNPRD